MVTNFDVYVNIRTIFKIFHQRGNIVNKIFHHRRVNLKKNIFYQRSLHAEKQSPGGTL